MVFDLKPCEVSFINSIVYSFTHLFVNSFIYSLIHSFIHSLTLTGERTGISISHTADWSCSTTTLLDASNVTYSRTLAACPRRCYEFNSCEQCLSEMGGEGGSRNCYWSTLLKQVCSTSYSKASSERNIRSLEAFKMHLKTHLFIQTGRAQRRRCSMLQM